MKKFGRMEFVGKYEDTNDILTMPFLPGIDACISIYKRNANGRLERGRLSVEALSGMGVPDETRKTIFLSFLENMADDKESEPVLMQMPFGHKISVLTASKKELRNTILDGYTFCSNQTLAYGASSIFIPNVLEKIGDAVGDLYIAPTSVHEVMIIPTDSAPSVKEILTVIHEQNQDRNYIGKEDILSDSLFFYNAKTRKVTEIKK